MTNRNPQIFICYAHKDNENPDPSKQWLDRLLEQLAPLELQGQAVIWSDQEIELGEEWHDKIQATLQQVKAAVLLVSPSFLASRYIRNSELPVLLKNAKDKGVVILPILLRQCLWRETKFRFPDPKEGSEELSLSSIQVPSTQPLNGLEENEQDEVLYQVAQRIYRIVNTDSIESDLVREPQQQTSQDPRNITVYGNYNENIQGNYIQQDRHQISSSSSLSNELEKEILEADLKARLEDLEALKKRLIRVVGTERNNCQREINDLLGVINEIKQQLDKLS